ncbi:hypothetical protein B0H14DRAFT_3445976 [Mycena olivaceomarginata]|nr:hypothetical protein B0H14DRAFT_3445976 [Mycena olivaceomarginata]
MSTYTSQSQVNRIAGARSAEQVTAADFVLTLLERDSLQSHECTISLLDNVGCIIEAFSQNSGSASSTYAWARKTIQKKTTEAINDEWNRWRDEIDADGDQIMDDFSDEDGFDEGG